MLGIFLATYAAVFLAEIAGDKLLYTTGVLAARYRSAPIMVGMAFAFTLKMGVAVAVGDAISRLPRLFVAALTAASVLGVAWAVWRKPDARNESKESHGAGKAAMLTFATIFFSEWGDVGQITAAAMAARYPAPIIVWAGAVSAMVTKGILAASLGGGVRKWIQANLSPKTIRYGGVGMLLVLGVLAVIETLVEGHA